MYQTRQPDTVWPERSIIHIKFRFIYYYMCINVVGHRRDIINQTISGQDERGRLMRRTIVRYVCLCLTMVLTMIAPRVKKRFPTLENFVDAGLLLENEKSILDHLNVKFPKPSKHW